MAVVTYAVLALALAALVAGFFVRTTALPLFVSVAASALVLVLIMRGWARRLRAADESRAAQAIERDEEEPEDIVVVDLEQTKQTPALVTRRRPPTAEAARRPREPVAEPAEETKKRRVFRRHTEETARVEEAVPRPRPRPRPTDYVELAPNGSDEPPPLEPPRKRKPAPKPSRSRAKPARTKAKAAPPKRSAPRSGDARIVVVIPGRPRYHVRRCRFVRDAKVTEMTEGAARRRGFEPCSACNP